MKEAEKKLYTLVIVLDVCRRKRNDAFILYMSDAAACECISVYHRSCRRGVKTVENTCSMQHAAYIAIVMFSLVDDLLRSSQTQRHDGLKIVPAIPSAHCQYQIVL